MNLIDRERETYEAAWAVDAYAEKSPGVIYAPVFLDMKARHFPTSWTETSTVLDAGCGAGAGAHALRNIGFQVHMCDITDAGCGAPDRYFSVACLWEPLAPQLPWTIGGKYDFIYCCDVMEHVPPTFAMLVVARLLDVTRRAAFFTISLMPDQFGAMIGHSLHQNVQTYPQWKEQLNAIGNVLEARDLGHCGIYLVAPR